MKNLNWWLIGAVSSCLLFWFVTIYIILSLFGGN